MSWHCDRCGKIRHGSGTRICEECAAALPPVRSEPLLAELQSLVELWLAENPLRTTTEGDWGRVTGHQECAETLQGIVNRHKANSAITSTKAPATAGKAKT
jgi:hypothetical protein